MEDFLNKNIKILKQVENKNNKLVSCCLFKLKNSYKDFNIYLNNLYLISNKILKNNFNLRIYIDNTVYLDNTIFNNLKKINCEIYLYDFKKYKVDNLYHINLFGTLMRFLPIFGHNSKKYEIIYIIDIDGDEFDMLLTFNEILIRKKLFYNNDFFYMGYFFYKERKLRNDFIPKIIAGRIISRINNFDLNILINFINNENDFIYSVDENFLGNVFIDYLKLNKIKFLTWITMSSKLFNYIDPNQLSKNNNINLKKYKNNFYKLINYIMDRGNIRFINFFEKTNQEEVFKNFFNYLNELKIKKNYILFNELELNYLLSFKKYYSLNYFINVINFENNKVNYIYLNKLEINY